MVSYLSVSVFFTSKLLQKLTKASDVHGILPLVVLPIYVGGLILPNIAILRFSENELYRYVCFTLVFVISLPILWLANHKYKKKQKALRKGW